MTLKRLAACLALVLTSSLGHAQPFPSKPIRIIVPSIAGSAPDVRVRHLYHPRPELTAPLFPCHPPAKTAVFLGTAVAHAPTGIVTPG
jgi:hypothetical protein